MGVRKALQDDSLGTPGQILESGSSSSLIDDYLEGINQIPEPATKSPLRRRNKKCTGYKFCKRDERRKSQGVRQARRNDNLKGLLGQSEQDTVSELGDMDYLTIQEPSFSAFAALFLEHEKMRIWNDFVNHTEEDQSKILSGLKEMTLDDEEDNDLEVIDDGELSEANIQSDKRSVHPGFTAEECFMRIDQKLRIFLKKQHLPKGVLKNLEDELVSFFLEWPSSVYISDATSSFDRMLVHALSQYLDLVSKSYDAEDGCRRTQVENKNVEFHPPTTGLTDYLEFKHGKH